jgi:hypothetical protein
MAPPGPDRPRASSASGLPARTSKAWGPLGSVLGYTTFGVLATIAVAWIGSAGMTIGGPIFAARSGGAAPTVWPDAVARDKPSAVASWEAPDSASYTAHPLWDRTTATWSTPDSTNGGAGGPGGGVRVRVAVATRAGAPFRALGSCDWYEGASPPTGGRVRVSMRHTVGELGTISFPGFYPLPLVDGPIPLGFVADAAFYAGGAWGLRALLAAVRRGRRRRGGRCHACGYDRHGLGPRDLCPECGASR